MRKILLMLLTVMFCINVDAQIVSIGTGTTANTNTSYPAPYGNYWWGARQQQMYTAAELLAAGVQPGSTIDSLGFNVLGPAVGTALTNFEIKIGGTADAQLTNTWLTGLNTAFGPVNYTPTVGVNLHDVGSFIWNGCDNLVIETCFNNTAFTNNEIIEQTNGLAGNYTHLYRADAAGVCGNTGTTSLFTDRANLYFTFSLPSGCIQPLCLKDSAVTPFSAVVYWNDVNATAPLFYDIELVPAGGSPTGVPTMSPATNPDTITGLTPSTMYDYYVRAHCSTTDTSAWSGPHTFTTLATCQDPSNLTATNITSGSADLDWTENGTATAWDIEIGLQNFVPTGTPVIPGVPSKPYTIGGLPPNTCFDYYVRAACGAVNGNSLWIGPFTFCTTLACDTPTSVTISNVTGTTADISWVDNNTPPATSWEVATVITGSPAPTSGTVISTNPYTIMGLTPLTSYEVYIRTNCGGTSGNSPWQGPYQFGTLTAPLNCAAGSPTIVYYEPFNQTSTVQSPLPAAWSQIRTASPFWQTESNGTSSGCGTSASATATPGYAYFEASGSANIPDTMTSPVIDLTNALGSARVSFYYHMQGTSIGTVTLYVDDGTTLTQVWTLSGAQQTSANDPWVITGADLSPWVGQTINLRFMGTALGCCCGDIGIDEITVEACLPQVTDMSADNIAAPANTTGCYTNAETIDVGITNQSLSSIDFSNDTVIVQVDVTGAVTQTLIDTLTTGVLAGAASQVVTMSSTVDMTTAGTYNMVASVSVMGDVDVTNDTMATAAVYNAGIGTSSIVADPKDLCVSGASVVSFIGTPNVGIQYQESLTGMAPWTNVGSGGPSYNTGTLTSTTFYRAMVNCNGATDSTTVDTVRVNNPVVASSMNDTICGSGSATLIANAGADNIKWFDAPTGGTLLATSDTLLTPVISSTDTFYAVPFSGGGSSFVGPPTLTSIGTGNGTSLGSIQFDVTNPAGITVQNVDLYPGTLGIGYNVEVRQGATFNGGTLIDFYSGTSTVGGNVAETVNVDLQIPPGTSYWISLAAANPSPNVASGVSSNPTLSFRRAGVTGVFPWTFPDITFSTTNAGTGFWYHIYNWELNSDCEGAAVPVIAVSTPGTGITASADQIVCWDSSITRPLTVTSTNTNYAYTWSPAAGLDMTTGDSVNASPTTNTQYIVSAFDASSGCGSTDTVNVTVQEEFWVATMSDPAYICGTDTVTLTAMDSIPAIPYCASGATNGFDTKIDTVTFGGVTFGSSPSATETYTDNTGSPIAVTAGAPIALDIVNGSSSAFYYGGTATVWIDYDQSGTFDASEQVYQFVLTGLNSIPSTTVTIPTTALNGITRMRIILPESGTTAACGTWTYGETEDYALDISGATPPVVPAYTYTWMPGMVSGSSQIVSPTTTSSFSVMQEDVNGCIAHDTLTLNVGAVSGDLAQAAPANASSTTGTATQAQTQPDNTSISYFDASCNLIARVDDGAGGNVLGNTMSEVTVEASVQTHNGEPFVRRWYQITPTSNGPADVVLYFTQADFDDYNAHPSVVAGVHDSLPTGPADAAGINRLRITKNDDGGLGINPVVLVPSSAPMWVAADNRWEVTLAVPSFSQFRAHALNGLNSPLAVSLTEFTVTKKGSVSLAAWVTETEINNSHFNLQRSLDGNTFTTLGKVNTKAVGGNSAIELNYNFTDKTPKAGRNYYRLEQVDREGNITYSQTVIVIWGADGSVVSIYPNPITNKVNIDVSTDKVAQLEARLLDMSGRVIKSAMQRTSKGVNSITLDVTDIAAGVYGVQVYQNNTLIHSTKVTKTEK